jgi:beta-glucosidase
MTLTFPDGFAWGTATSAYQIEGAVDVDGRGPSIWDDFCRQPGAIAGGDTGDVAADHYHRYEADVALMADLGHNAYRLSISWPRVQPTGAGAVNQAGLDFYRRLLDALRARDIAPLVTLYHWDLPSALQRDGGWAQRSIVDRFAEYARIVAEALGDRVAAWNTLNEPWVSAFTGHLEGVHAPGLRDPAVACAVAHHLLVAHGRAVEVLRAASGAEVGIALNMSPATPATDAPEDQEAADWIEAELRRWFLEPVLDSRYPSELAQERAPLLDGVVQDGDLALAAQPLDFLGINYYFPLTVGRAESPSDEPRGPFTTGGRVRFHPLPGDRTDMGWPIDASGLSRLLTRLAADHPNLPPVAITENGVAYDDPVELDGSVHDRRRIDYLDGHLRAVHEAITAGVDVRGYYVWSLIDNFEWAKGYAMRFGLVHVDRDTMERRPRDSAYWYRDVIARNGLP